MGERWRSIVSLSTVHRLTVGRQLTNPIHRTGSKIVSETYRKFTCTNWAISFFFPSFSEVVGKKPYPQVHHARAPSFISFSFLSLLSRSTQETESEKDRRLLKEKEWHHAKVISAFFSASDTVPQAKLIDRHGYRYFRVHLLLHCSWMASGKEMSKESSSEQAKMKRKKLMAFYLGGKNK